MNSSTSLPHNGVILDTNVISVFAKINRLDLLLKIFNSTRHEIQFYITPTIQNELVTGLQNNIPYLADALRLVEAGKLQILQPTKADQLVIRGLPAKLALVKPKQLRSVTVLPWYLLHMTEKQLTIASEWVFPAFG